MDRPGAAVDRLAALDALRKKARTLRLGWGFVLAGTVYPDGPAAHLERQRTLTRAS